MQYDFDEVIDRTGTDSLKYDFAAQRGKPTDILPLWVADMDFRVPPAVARVLEEKSRHGIFGYTESGQDYFDTLQRWFARHFDWRIDADWLVKTPGIVYAICAAIRGLTRSGDSVLIQQPVYYPFAQSIRSNDRRLVVNRLVYADGGYSIDFEDFEALIVKNSVKLFILCSPHNPVGRVWTEDELVRMGEICLRHGVLVVSDEIHADFVYPGHKHLVFANLRPEFSPIAITCTAPSKTFNLAGLQVSNIFIENRIMRRIFQQEIEKSGYSQLNTMGIAACRAAYAEGGEWLEALKAYLKENLDFMRGFLHEKLSKIKLVEPDGTYLVWLDCQELGFSDAALEELIVNEAGLWLDAGTIFGAGGKGFQRVNIACPRSVLRRALEQLERALVSPVVE